MMNSISDLRRFAMWLIALGGWAATGLLTVVIMTVGGSALLVVLSALVNMPLTINLFFKRTDRLCRVIAGMAAAFQAMLLCMSAIGMQWHAETHLLFLIALVTLMLLCDYLPMVIASSIIIAHDAILSAGLSGMNHGVDGSGLVVGLHTAIIVAITALLCALTVGLNRIFGNIEDARQKSERQADLLEEQAGELQAALHRVELERQAKEKVEAEEAEQRRKDFARFSKEFENSVAGVIASVASTANVLEQATKEMDRISHETGDRASEVADAAESASHASQTVARGVMELSSSISNIAANVEQQKQLTSQATARSSSGGKAVESLSSHSDTIEDATQSIVKIAERTNLLSLNAAIEAASAGPSGRGFQIVAQEVKVLADQASDCASEIENILSGVRDGTIEAEGSFSKIEDVISELDKAAAAIRWDVDDQRKSADTISNYARTAADEVGSMAERSRSLASSAETTRKLSSELDRAADALIANVRSLEDTTATFVDKLKAA